MTPCLICKFYQSKTPSYGICRRNPPQIITRVHTLAANDNACRYEPEVDSCTETEWPEVKPDDWCGEHASKY